MIPWLVALMLAACGPSIARNPVPVDLTDAVSPVGFTDIRMWGDFNDRAVIETMMLNRAEQLRERFGPGGPDSEEPLLNYLALSGGGQYGAFAAGVLTAWTQTGTRPVFDAVTGISTGSIIAPFAFLGPAYDGVLEEIYTTTRTEDMLSPTVLSSLFGGSALADTTPLRERIATYVTPDLLAAIAAEHAKGRTLFVGTTNIDAGRSVIWNMGKIASEGTPQALALFRDVILASAAIPMAFPPVFFEVEADGTQYQEMHVDGGVTSQVTILSPQIPGYLLDEVAQVEVDRNLFVIVNGAVVPPPDVVEATMINIGRSSIERLWYAQAVGDLYKIHAVAERDDLDVRYAWIPQTFQAEPAEEFDPVFMGELFGLGQTLMSSGTLWHDAPPNFTAPGTTAVERGDEPMPVLTE